MSTASVLDIGCGTGMLLRQARETGHRGRLAGLDPADAMLDQARGRTDIEWALGDLSTVSWEGEFDLVVMTGHAFQVLVEDDQLRAALAAIRSALTEGGRFAFETRNPLAPAEPGPRDANIERAVPSLALSIQGCAGRLSLEDGGDPSGHGRQDQRP